MVSINFEGAKQFYASQPDKAAAQAAFDTLVNGTGAGNDFIGWVDLPVNYDREEFARIQAAAKKIRSDSKALVVIGIGGSYLGARAVVELLKSPNYNALPKNTPDIYFAGNGISSDAVTEILAMIGDRDFSVNVISKSGTTTEPAIAFRIFKAALEKKYGVEGAAMAFTLYLQGVNDIGPVKTSLLSCAELVTAGVLTSVWLKTPLAWQDVLGMALILGMVAFLAVPGRTTPNTTRSNS